MKNYRRIFLAALAAGLLLAGCSTVSAPAPGTGPQPIYDENGNIVWQPPSSRRQYPQPPAEIPQGDTRAEETSEKPYDSGEMSVPPDSRPTPRIGSGEGTSQEKSSEDGHLLAAVSPLAEQAEEQMRMGDLDRAYATAERAVRIDPGNAEMWNLMARIQFKKENYSQAEQLARKSNLQAEGNRSLQSVNWKIIAAVLSKKGQEEEARKALERARELE